MPRKTRRQLMGGKEEDRERREREQALERLRWELRALGRLRPDWIDTWAWEERRSA